MNIRNNNNHFQKTILKKNIDIAYNSSCSLISICCDDSEFVIDCIKSCEIEILNVNFKNIEFTDENFKKNITNPGFKGVIFIEHSKSFSFYDYKKIQTHIEKNRKTKIKLIIVFKEKETDEIMLNNIIKNDAICFYSRPKENLNERHFINLITTNNGLEKIKKIHSALFLSLNYISKNIYSNITLNQTAKAAFVSSSHLSYLFRTKLNTNFKNVTFIMKTLKAKEILHENPNYNLTDIAINLGFYDLSHFGKVFKKYEGVSIGKYKESVIKE